jgi:hypothetical protein
MLPHPSSGSWTEKSRGHGKNIILVNKILEVIDSEKKKKYNGRGLILFYTGHP